MCVRSSRIRTGARHARTSVSGIVTMTSVAASAGSAVGRSVVGSSVVVVVLVVVLIMVLIGLDEMVSVVVVSMVVVATFSRIPTILFSPN